MKATIDVAENNVRAVPGSNSYRNMIKIRLCCCCTDSVGYSTLMSVGDIVF